MLFFHRRQEAGQYTAAMSFTPTGQPQLLSL
ncbi:hypothetical protein CTS44_16078 [Comamonas thiooxydans]|nr:hypothetical protein CTS44_16078 [Comamonas thiooxydans]